MIAAVAAIVAAIAVVGLMLELGELKRRVRLLEDRAGRLEVERDWSPLERALARELGPLMPAPPPPRRPHPRRRGPGRMAP